MASVPVVQRVVAIFWPSFISAGIATIIFFTIFDPDAVFSDYDISRLAAYSVGFFTFWLFGVLNCMATCLYMKPCKNPDKYDNC